MQIGGIRGIRPVHYEKDIARKRLALEQIGVGGSRRRRKMIQTNDISHEYDRSMTDVYRLRLVSTKKEIFLGGILSSLVEIFIKSRVGRKEFQ